MIAVVMPPSRSCVLAEDLFDAVSKVASVLEVSGMRQIDLMSGKIDKVPPVEDLM
jgi:hypothetical protein